MPSGGSPPKGLWLVVGIAVVAWFALAKPIFHALNKMFYNILSVKAIGRVVYWFQGVSGFNVYHPIFWSKILYSVVILVLIEATLWFYARNRTERRFALAMPILALAGAIFLNLVGKLLGNQWVETFSRDSFEFILSPLPVAFVIPAMTLLRQGRRNPGKEGK